MYYIAQTQGAGPLSIRTLKGDCPQVSEGPVEAWSMLHALAAKPFRPCCRLAQCI